MSRRRKKKTTTQIVLRGIAPSVVVYILGLLITHAGPINYFLLYFWLSPFMHLLGGFAMGIGLYTVYRDLRTRLKLAIKPRWLFGLLFLSTIAFVTVLWEAYELYIHVVFLADVQPNVADTVADMLLGILGGAMVYVYVFLLIKPKWLK